ncbi:site-specific DNA-methyltransferase, partial [Flavobacteriaceae bacterium]|nr:site-specific DNA-methyltransferase [Flavobacteriaceae bacterium]
IANYAIENANRVFRTASVTGGALKKRKETIKLSKSQKTKIVRHPNDDMDYRFIGGERILFYKERLTDIDGELLPGIVLTDLWTDISIEGIAKEGGVKFERGKKPEKLLKRIIDLTTTENDIVLDYHLGSGTTAAVAHKMKRQYIGIEQLDYGENDSTIRLQNVINADSSGVSKAVNWQGGGSFTYLELKKYNQTFIEHIEAAKNSKQLLKIWEQMKAKSFLNYNVDLKKQDAHIEDFKQLELAQQKEHLVALLDKNQLYVNVSSMADGDFEVHPEDQKVTADFYQLNR